MKIIYLQDSHIKGINPENRIGDYYQDVMAKMKETIDTAKKMKVDAIIHGGDLYHSSNVSLIMVDEFVDMVEESKIPWYIVPGNHDEIGHDWGLSAGTTLAHIFRRSKLINELGYIVTPDDDQSLIQGFRYYHNIEEDIKKKGIEATKLKDSENIFKIAIVHAFITLKPFLPTVMHIVARDIKTIFDIVLCAHYHMGWGIKEINGVKFINIGAIGRIGIDGVKQVPQIAYIDTETREIRLIPLKSAKKGEEVFDLAKVKESKEFDADIDNFIKSLNSVKMESLDIKGIVEYLANENKIEDEVREEIITRIGRE